MPWQAQHRAPNQRLGVNHSVEQQYRSLLYCGSFPHSHVQGLGCTGLYGLPLTFLIRVLLCLQPLMLEIDLLVFEPLEHQRLQ